MLLRGTIAQIVHELQAAWECIRCGEIYRNGAQANTCHPSEVMMVAHEAMTRQPVH